MIDWTYKECHFAIYGKSPEKTADRDMAGKIALEMIQNLGTDTTNIKINYGASSIYGGSGFNPDEEYTDWQWWLAGCGEASVSESNESANSNRVIKWFDFLNGDEMVSDDIKEYNLEEFSEVTFRWSYTALEAVTDEETVSLYTGMPIWSVYFYDLTGDGHSDICSTISCGSGMIDNRIISYDYIEGAGYVLSDRGNFDYVLNMQEDSLVAEKRAYNQDEIIESGKLIFLDDKIQIKTE